MRPGNQLKTPSKRLGTGSEMQRYRIKHTHSAEDGFQTFLVPDDNGDLCKYEDVEEEVKRICNTLEIELEDMPDPVYLIKKFLAYFRKVIISNEKV